MPRVVALLRAINITGRNVKMDALRGHFTDLSLANVATYIASGNVLFDADAAGTALEQRIEAHLRVALGYEVATFLRTTGELAAVAAHQPFDPTETAAAFGMMVLFLKAPPDEAATARLMGYRRASDDFVVHVREVYWLRRTQQSETNFAAATLERILRAPATARSITTVRQLAGM